MKIPLYLISTSPYRSLPAGGISLVLEPVHIRIIKLLYLKNFLQIFISFLSHFVYLRKNGLVLNVVVPVLLLIVLLFVICRESWNLWFLILGLETLLLFLNNFERIVNFLKEISRLDNFKVYLQPITALTIALFFL